MSATRLSMLLLMALTNACATMTGGTTQTVYFQSRPPGATVHVDGHTVETPGSLDLERKHTYEVRFEKQGYLPSRRHIGHSLRQEFFWNGLLGFFVDTGTGGRYQLVPARVETILVPDPLPQDALGHEDSDTSSVSQAIPSQQ